MKSRTRRIVGVALAMAWLLGGGGTLEARTLAFEPNLGQTDGRVKFLSHGDGYLLFLTPQEATLALQGRDGTGRSLRLRWMGASPAPVLSGEAPLRGRSHYLRGKDPARWYRDVPNYGRVRYEEVYPGVDLLFYGREGRLEYDLLLEPGADPGVVRLAVDGADRLAIDAAGDLVATLGGEEVRFLRPFSYQEIGGVRREVASRYRLLAGGEVGFAVDAHDPARPLVIDPVVLYSVRVGGSGGAVDSIAVGVDADGNTYHAGQTNSPELPLQYGPPATVSTWPPNPVILDAFVIMLDPAGEVVFSTYIGTENFDEATDLAVSPLSGVWVSGVTSNFDGMDGWVVHLDPFGSPVYWTGSFPSYQSRSRATGVAVDPLGNAYVAGFNSYGAQDAWAVKVSPEGQILYSAYLGGEWGGVEPSGIAADAAGNVWVTGTTWTSESFPLVRPFQSALKGGRDAFLVKLDSSGRVVFSTYLGGSGSEEGRNVAVGPDGSVYVAGYTDSNDFPTRQPLQPTRRGTWDLFLSRFSPAAYLLASTYLGSSGSDALDGLAVDRSGIVYLASASGPDDSPLRDPALPGCTAALLGSLDRSLQSVLQTACLPGKIVLDIAANSPRLLYVTGRESNAYDLFAAKLAFNRPPQCGGAFASLATLWPADGKLLPVTVRGVTDPERDPVTITVTSVFQDEFLTSLGTPDASGVGTSTARLRASRLTGGDGRVYHLRFTATDTWGDTCSGAVKVCVPVTEGGTCGDGGARIDSTRAY